MELLTVEGDRVREITAFADSAALYPRFGLPGETRGLAPKDEDEAEATAPDAPRVVRLTPAAFGCAP